jgi:hypothetical protein
MALASLDSFSEAQQVHDAAAKLTGSAFVGIERNLYGEFLNSNGIYVKIPWAEGEPSYGYKEDCVSISRDLEGYNDVPCDAELNFICEKV